VKVNWPDIFSAQSGVTAVVWDLIVIGLAVEAFRWLKRWFRTQSEEVQKKVVAKVLNFVGHVAVVALCSYFAAHVLWSLTNNVAGQLSASIHKGADFRTEVQAMGLGETGQRNEGVQFLLKISNAGDPSVTSGWRLTVRGIDKQTATGLPVWEDALTMAITNWNTDGSKNVYDGKDSLIRKTDDIPVATGSKVEGHVLFGITNVNKAWLSAPGTIFEVAYQDTAGKTYTATVVIPTPPK
jgi:hypothetical protein